VSGVLDGPVFVGGAERSATRQVRERPPAARLVESA
jgi:hypothetical protein